MPDLDRRHAIAGLGVLSSSAARAQARAGARLQSWPLATPSRAAFERIGFPREATLIRRILGRPGAVWLPESGTGHLSVIRIA